MEYIIYADESEKQGRFFSNFYGGTLVRSTDLLAVESALKETKRSQNLLQEVKWTKVTQNYLSKYLSLMDHFFDLVVQDKAKVRIMFTQNANRPTGLAAYHHEHEFYLLYYQFIKHAFGLQHAGTPGKKTPLRIYLDEVPLTRTKNAEFKRYLASLSNLPGFQHAGIVVPYDQIAHVDSHNHVLLQCTDIVLGAIRFRLNDQHKAKPPDGRQRGSRTIAKAKLYRHINRRIRQIYPGFNIGVSTSDRGDPTNRWHDSYRHWVFVPAESSFDPTRTKRKR